MSDRADDDPPAPADAADVTVIVPYGGSRRHLLATLWGLAAQRHPGARLQVIVVECPSAEGGGRALRAIGRTLGLEWLRFGRQGFAPAGARNLGLAAAEGRIVVSVDDDMVLPPWAVAAHAARHCRRPVATFGLRTFIRLPSGLRIGRDVHGRLAGLPELPASLSNRHGHRRDWRLRDARRIGRHPHPYHCFHGCNVSYDRRQALDVGGWCEAFDGSWGYEDVEFGARLRAGGAPIVWVPEATGVHLEGEAAVARRRRLDRARNLRLVSERVEGYAEYRHRASAGQPARDEHLVAVEPA